MDKCNTIRKVGLNHAKVHIVRKFMKKLFSVNQRERQEYLKSISSAELRLIDEVLINILRGNISITYEKYSLLKRVKKYLYMLHSNKTSKRVKKQILTSIKGLHILSIVLPAVIEFLS